MGRSTMLAGGRRGSVGWWLLAIVATIVAVGLLLLPATRRGVPEAARRSACANNLKRIGEALRAYVDEHGTLPPACTVDAAGRPLASWRVSLLPYLDEALPPSSIDPANPAATPHVFRCPSARLGPGMTTYQLVVSPDGLVRPDGPATREELAAADPRTLLVVDVPASRAVPWMSPEDTASAVLAAGPSGSHLEGVMALRADGSVMPVYLEDFSPAERRSLVTPAADDPPSGR